MTSGPPKNDPIVPQQQQQQQQKAINILILGSLSIGIGCLAYVMAATLSYVYLNILFLLTQKPGVAIVRICAADSI